MFDDLPMENSMEENIQLLAVNLVKIEKTMASMSTQVAKALRQKEDIDELRGDMTELRHDVTAAFIKLNDLEQRDRCHNTKIFNYKVKPIHLKDEDLLIEKIYKDLFEPAMRRSYEAGRLSHVPDSAYCISTAHALPAKAGEIPAIHVKFTTRRFLHTWVRHSKSVLKKFNTDRKLKPEDAVRCGRDLTEINSDAFGRLKKMKNVQRVWVNDWHIHYQTSDEKKHRVFNPTAESQLQMNMRILGPKWYRTHHNKSTTNPLLQDEGNKLDAGTIRLEDATVLPAATVDGEWREAKGKGKGKKGGGQKPPPPKLNKDPSPLKTRSQRSSADNSSNNSNSNSRNVDQSAVPGTSGTRKVAATATLPPGAPDMTRSRTPSPNARSTPPSSPLSPATREADTGEDSSSVLATPKAKND